MEKLDFTELHKEKLALIFENIDILNAMKESVHHQIQDIY